MSMRETNILLTAVGRRAYLVEYFKEALRGTGGKVYAANCVRDTTGLLAADDFEIVPKSADPGYVDSLVELCRRWRIALLFSIHDWDAPVIARNRERFLAVGTTPVMGDARLLSTCLDKYSTASAMEEIGVAVPWTTLSLSDAAAKMRELRCPMIVKPRWGQGSLGLFKVYSEKELEWAFNLSDVLARRFAANCPEIDVSQPQVVVQQFISGEEYGCDIVNGLDGQFRRAFVKHKLGMRAGETDAAESADVPSIAAAAEKVGRWSRHLGCMDSDWIVGDDGVPCLVELNPRFGGGYPFTHLSGANVVKACVDWANGVDDGSWCEDYRVGVKIGKEIGLRVYGDSRNT